MEGDRRGPQARLAEPYAVGSRLARRHLAISASHAALDLIEDQQAIVLVAEPARRGQEFRRAGNHAAFALHRLEDHGADVIAALFGEGRLEPGDIVVADVGEAGRTGAEAGGVLGLPSGGDREKRPAMSASRCR